MLNHSSATICSIAEGRMITAVGTLERSERGKVGDSAYVHPVIEASELYLWSGDSENSNRTSVHFGFGLG